MKILVTGATGYVGGRLIPRLLEHGHSVRVLVREAERIAGRPWAEAVDIHLGDLLDPTTLEGLCTGCDVAYFLVHSMASTRDFAALDDQVTRNFCDAAQGLSHVIYLGGLLPQTATPSPHLSSRAEVGRLLAEKLPTTEFRAGPIIGSGSASFEMVRYLTDRLPAMVTPRWILNRVQPIAIRNILAYLIAALERGPSGIVEVGAPALTFKEMMLQYAALRGYRRIIIPLPVLAPRLAARWVGLITPISNRLAVPLVEGVNHSLFADDAAARRLFPEIIPIPYQQAVQLALEKIRMGDVETRWTGASGPTAHLHDWEGTVRERRTLHVDLPPHAVFSAFTRLGGDQGWLVWNSLWRIRGWMDKLIGGPGLRRGRRDPEALLTGDVVDFWRVETIVPDALLLLRAEMRLPGRAWLQFKAVPEGTGTRLIQTAIFHPDGLAGALYWYSLYPIHRFIFSDMVRGIAAFAKRLQPSVAAPEPTA
jgi:uncharacterized protein YbjT (DUF2867 family)